VGASFGRRSKDVGDRLQNALTVRQDFTIPEPENAPALLPQLSVPLLVVTRACILAAVSLDDQPCFNASEVGDVGRDRELAPKSPSEPRFAEFFPQHLLGIGHASAQLARVFR